MRTPPGIPSGRYWPGYDRGSRPLRMRDSARLNPDFHSPNPYPCTVDPRHLPSYR
jgi:hypothetical protein